MKNKIFLFTLLLSIIILCFFSFVDLKPNLKEKNDIESIKGIDVSHHNKILNWSYLKNNVKFIIIKATEGKSYKDPKFNDYWKKSKRYGLVRGAYHFFSYNTTAEEQFKNFKEQVFLSKGDLPPIVDVEDRRINMDEVNKWCDLVEKHYGVKPIVYSEFLFFKVLMDGKIKDYKLWIYFDEKYSAIPNFNNYDCVLWQYSHKGTIKGINGDVDLDSYLHSEDEFNRLLID
jgi:lysozyme